VHRPETGEHERELLLHAPVRLRDVLRHPRGHALDERDPGPTADRRDGHRQLLLAGRAEGVALREATDGGHDLGGTLGEPVAAEGGVVGDEEQPLVVQLDDLPPALGGGGELLEGGLVLHHENELGHDVSFFSRFLRCLLLRVRCQNLAVFLQQHPVDIF